MHIINGFLLINLFTNMLTFLSFSSLNPFLDLSNSLVLGRQNREKESKMAVAKRQGRFKDQSEDFRQNKQHSWLSPICIGQAQVEEKTYKRRSQSAFSRTLSCVHARTLSLSFFLPTHSSTLFSSSLGFSCYLLNKIQL